MSQAQYKECLSQFQSALKAIAFYPDGHPGVQNPVNAFTQSMLELLDAGHRVVLGVLDDVVVLDEIPFYETDGIWKPVFKALTLIGVESVTFEPDLEARDVTGILRWFKRATSEDQIDLATAWKEEEIQHATFQQNHEGESTHARAYKTYEESFGIVVDLMSQLRMGKVPSTDQAVHVINDMRDIVLQDSSAMLGMAMMKNYDQYTYAHSVNVAIFCLSLGHFIELPPDELRSFGLAGLLHDMGKVRTDEEILRKPGALSDDEMRLMKLHPELGAEILENMRGIDPAAKAMVLQHHTRFDGKGYPNLPSKRNVHQLADAVALADCYDALTTTRPYQRARHPSDAAIIMRRGAGSAFNPETVDHFIAMLGAYPTGEAVRLATGEVAVVVGSNPMDTTTPIVRLVTDSDGQLLAESIRVELADPKETERSIVTSVNVLAKGIDIAAVLEAEMNED